jgi:transcriptional regulator with XRE-family HTH domain
MKGKLISKNMKKDTNKNQNRFLWQARQRSGLSQKAIAFLLGRKFTDEISRYESGQRIPTLQNALKLEIIYRVPIRLLFYELFLNSHWQIRDRSTKYRELFPEENLSKDSLAEHLRQEDYCVYAELLKTPNLPPIEKERIYSHIRHLATAINKLDEKNNN